MTDGAQDHFKTLVWDNLVTVGLKLLEADIPILAVEPLRTVVEWAARVLADYVYKGGKFIVDWETVIFRDEKAKHEFNQASSRLHVVAYDKGVESKEYKEAHAKEKAALAELMHFHV